MPSEVIVTRASGATGFRIGEVVHVRGDRVVERAQANLAANVLGAIGLSLGWTVVFGGVHVVLLDAGLVAPAPAAQQTLWVSAATPGRATNVAPGIARPFATILDASRYAQDGSVICILSDAPNGGSSGGGSFDLMFSGSFPTGIA